MNRVFRFLALGLLVASGAALDLACSSDSNPGNYGDACTVYAVGASCTGDLLCRCQLQSEQGCFCTQSCVTAVTCPGKFDQCLLANDPSQTDVTPSDFCFQFLQDGGSLP
jgi:hypothetical protein